jgi:hypothetical protein
MKMFRRKELPSEHLLFFHQHWYSQRGKAFYAIEYVLAHPSRLYGLLTNVRLVFSVFVKHSTVECLLMATVRCHGENPTTSVRRADDVASSL